MDRKEFIKACGFACIAGGTLSVLLQGCTGSKILTTQLDGDSINIPVAEFEIMKDNVKSYRKYIVVQNQKLQYPIYVSRISKNEYTALYMKCTHQGAELTAYGDKMVCSAHGSEFDNRGNATNPPASQPLKSFPVILDDKNLKISLKTS
jgi:Rieske Fe-S protein